MNFKENAYNDYMKSSFFLAVYTYNFYLQIPLKIKCDFKAISSLITTFSVGKLRPAHESGFYFASLMRIIQVMHYHATERTHL